MTDSTNQANENLIAVAADAERRYAQLQELFTSFLGNMPALSFLKDDEGRYLYASRSFAEFFNTSPSQFLSKTDLEWLPEDIARQFMENDAQVRRTGIPIEVIETVPKGDKLIESLVQKFPVPVSDPSNPAASRVFVGGIAIDITERQNNSKRVAELASELETLAYTVSHELQEPVNTIKSYHKLLAIRYKDRLDADAGGFIEKCTEAAVTIEKMIDALWTFARIEKDQSFRLIAPDRALGAALAHLSDLIVGTSATINYDPLPAVYACEDQLELLFTELIRNALQNSPKNPNVRIGVREASDPEFVRFYVSDNGVGIDKMFAKDIFRLFRRHPSQRPDSSGSGMGLPIAQRVVQHHGGTLEVDSEPGRGATFIFTLRKQQPAL